ncbi:MAG: PhaM family polyhydroxyalkanoate granule multifunctional regulatory protein [Burkholderiales bacterium]
MSDTDTTGFGKFVPGFDFLQGLAKGATNNIPQMPNLGNWVAPTLNVDELEKRIEELKAVHFWLEQNSRALGATIQALEVQKMTLSTLKGMNFNIGDVANALKLRAAESVQSGVQRVTERAASTAKTISDVATGNSGASAKVSKAAAGMGAMVDPLQLWGSLTQQFQQIAAGAFKEATTKTAMDMTKNMASGMAKEAVKSATTAGKKAATGAVKRVTKPVARKTTPRSR